MTTSSDRLYQLLPAIYRIRDAEQGEPLRALLGILDAQLAAVEADITGLYENWFVETSDEWVVPYLGDLLGVRGLNTLPETSFSQRAYVANTLFYRRRKGTAHVLEVLAGDVTGWPAQGIEYFELLQTTQYLNHLRPFNTTPDLRDTNRLNLLETPFDSLPHSADVRSIHNRRGRHNLPNLGIFLWRLQNYPLLAATARQAGAPNAHGYHFSPLGNPAPLFNAPAGPGAPEEQRVPAPIRPLDFQLDLEAYQDQYASAASPPGNSRYYGPERSLQIISGNTPIPPGDVLCKDLRDWARPPAGKVAVDVRLGRMTFAAGEEPATSPVVAYHYGFSADIGGGPYDRRQRIREIRLPVKEFPVGAGKTHADLAAALTAWENDLPVNKPPAVIRIYDSATYTAHLSIALPAEGMLVIDCENGERPTLIGASPLTITSAAASSDQVAEVTLSGLVLEGHLAVSGKLALTLTDCTLIPGRKLDQDGYPEEPAQASLVVSGADLVDTSLIIRRSIVGPLELPEACRELIVSDTLVVAPLARDAAEPSRAAIAAGASGANSGPAASLERVTVFGTVHVRQLDLASEVIFVHPVTADRRQVGCARFSYIPEGSHTPRRYRCQPDLAIAARQQELDPLPVPPGEVAGIVLRLRPQFTSLRYGQAAFAQLAAACAGEIKTGAEDGAEMGAFSLLKQPQRLANMRVALDEYLRFGLVAGIFLVT
ncbi:MAG: hypothetical protein JXB85_15510 [Anaerolineales bacterium]|nr:hypothetical protein [Anaerolineales bacterium]